VVLSSLLKGVFPFSIKGIPSGANNYGRKEAFPKGFMLKKCIVGFIMLN
jgi:hypothetical protein